MVSLKREKMSFLLVLRELKEETGFVGEQPQFLGVVRPNAAILSNSCHVVLVRETLARLHHLTLISTKNL